MACIVGVYIVMACVVMAYIVFWALTVNPTFAACRELLDAVLELAAAHPEVPCLLTLQSLGTNTIQDQHCLGPTLFATDTTSRQHYLSVMSTHMSVHTRVRTCPHPRPHTRTRAHTCLHTRLHTRARTRARARIHMHMSVHAYRADEVRSKQP